MINLLVENKQLIKEIVEQSKKKNILSQEALDEEMKQKIADFKTKLTSAFKAAKKNRRLWSGGDVVDQIWSFGPQEDGPNLLVNKIPEYERPSVWKLAEDQGENKTR